MPTFYIFYINLQRLLFFIIRSMAMPLSIQFSHV